MFCVPRLELTPPYIKIFQLANTENNDFCLLNLRWILDASGWQKPSIYRVLKGCMYATPSTHHAYFFRYYIKQTHQKSIIKSTTPHNRIAYRIKPIKTNNSRMIEILHI